MIRPHMTLSFVHSPSPLKSNQRDVQGKVGHGRMRPGKRMHSPSLTSPGLDPWSTSTFWTHCLAASWLPVALETHSLDKECDLIGRDRKDKHHRQHSQIRQALERESTNKIVAVHNMQGVLKCLTSCQEKVLCFVSATNLAWQGSDSVAVADRSRQVQPDMFPFPCIHCRPRFSLLSLHPQLSSQVGQLLCFYFFYLLSVISYLLLLSSDANFTKRLHNNNRSQ